MPPDPPPGPPDDASKLIVAETPPPPEELPDVAVAKEPKLVFCPEEPIETLNT